MPEAELVRQISWLHPFKRLDAMALQRPELQKLGTALKYLVPVLTPATLAVLYLAAPGATTLFGLALYAALGGAAGTAASRGAAKTFRIAALNRENTGLEKRITDLDGENSGLKERVTTLEKRKLSLIDKLRELRVPEAEINEETFDGRNMFRRALGVGGMAVAILVRNKDMDVEKVFKVPRPDILNAPLEMARFKGNEAKTMLELNHERVVRFFTLSYMKREVYVELLRLSGLQEAESLRLSMDSIPEEIPYIEMEYVKGHVLSEVMKKGPMPIDQVIKLAIDIAETLWYVSSKGIIHRDLKPDNIFLVPDEYNPGTWTIKIGDFGLAKITEQSALRPSINLTQMNVVMGTPQYMSPEQATGLPVDWTTDQYALGAIIYEMLTGKLPYRGGTVLGDQRALGTYLTKIVTEPHVDIRKLMAVPESLARVIDKMLAKNRDNRFATWKDCVDELKAVDPNETIGTEATSVSVNPLVGEGPKKKPR